MPAPFHGDWAPTAAACSDGYARRTITGPMNTEGDYWGVVKSVKVLGPRRILVKEADDDFGLPMTVDYVLSRGGRTLTMHVIERNRKMVFEQRIRLVRCGAANGQSNG
jgi:hypothetical protein